MIRKLLLAFPLALALSASRPARAVSSAELYQNASYTYGRFEARIRFAAGDGVVSSFFMWKPGSEMAGTFWNELDFEKLGADCRMQTNPLYGAPVGDHGQIASGTPDLCGEYHTYAFEWTPTYIAWQIDGIEVRREAGEVAAAFEQNAASGMQIHFNLWPGDASFGGNFDPAVLPVQQFISWAQYSSFDNGSFTVQWREDFAAGALPSGWAMGNWASPKNHSTHAPANVSFEGEMAVLSLTADDALGFAGEPPPDGAVNVADGGTAGSSSSGSTAPGEVGAAGSGAGGTSTAGSSTAGSAPTGSVPYGTGGASSTSNGSAGSAAETTPINGTAGGPSAPSLPPSEPRSSSGCSVGMTHASDSDWLWLAAGIALASGQRRRAVRQRTRPASEH